MSAYVELHASSAFSFLRGASLPEGLAAEAARLELPGLAILDRDGVYGAPRLYGEAREQSIKPMVGAEITMEDGSAVPLLVMNRTGYQNLCRLISTSKLEARPPGLEPKDLPPGADPYERKRPCFARWSELEAHAEGLVALTGDEDGPVLRAWRSGGADAAEAALVRLRRIFGDAHLYVELQRQRVRGEEARVRMLTALAARESLPLLATGGVLYAQRPERLIADVFTCLRHHTTLDKAGRLLAANAERRLRPAAVMQRLFADLPEALTNSVHLAERLDFTLKDLGYRFPDYPVPAGETMESYLRKQAFDGARTRLGTLTPALKAQFEKELALINKLGFAGYFLIVWDICRWCREERGILVQGRGSAANSAVCYALGITAVNPLRYQLLFERFLSEGRVGKDGHPSWPDIDLDLPSGSQREAVIQEIYQRYAPRGAAMVANVISYRGRSTARELGKVLELPEDVMDRFSALYANGDFPHTLKLDKQLAWAGLPAEHPRLAAMLGLYQQMQGLPRHLGQHSGGMILCPGMLDKVVPIEPASMEGRCVVQWDKDDCEDLGLVKIDFLGLGMMAVLEETFETCTVRGRPLALHTIPQEDKETFEAMKRADTVGVFQIESRAQMATLPRLKPDCFYDVAMQVSIVRPGPIVGHLVHPLIRRRSGLEPVTFIDASVDAIVRPTLERTYGVILFQEQMLKIAMDLANFTGGEAEELRRAMGFTRNRDRLTRALVKLREALKREGRNQAVIDKVVDSCTSFAAYGFPESHAISFALLAYASTWLKVHRPAEFYSALLNNQPMGFYSPATLIQDARRHGIRVRPVCIAQSGWKCTVEDDATFRIGLSYVKGVRKASVEAMLSARAERAFSSLDDFIARSRFSPGELRALAAVGALNTLAAHRRAALWQIEAAWTPAESLFRQAMLDMDDTLAVAEPAAGQGSAAAGVPLAAMSPAERWQADFRGMALTAGEHPMRLVRPQLPDAWRASDLPLGRNGERVQIAGSVICRQRPGTAKGFVFISLEDETGIANAVVRPDVFEKLRLVINEASALSITGRLQNQSGVIHVQAQEIVPLYLAALPAQASHDFR